jgi:hypothetical protein
MPRAKEGLERASLRSGRRKKGDKPAVYAAGWLAVDGPSDEDMIRVAGSTHSEIFLTAETRNIFKQLKKTGEWYRFAYMLTED